jgi:hypothetical protein
MHCVHHGVLSVKHCKSFSCGHIYNTKPKQKPEPIPGAASQQEATGLIVVVLAGGDERHQREADSKTAATVEYANFED